MHELLPRWRDASNPPAQCKRKTSKRDDDAGKDALQRINSKSGRPRALVIELEGSQIPLQEAAVRSEGGITIVWGLSNR